MKLFCLPLLAILGVSSTVAAQSFPGAGGQLQQLPPTPVPQRSAPDLHIARRASPSDFGPEGARVLVQSLRVTGQTRFSESQLIAIAGFQAHSMLSLADLRRMAARITQFYNQHGYFVAQAYVPAQETHGGSVTIEVIEGRYDKIGLNNQTNLSDRVARGVMSGLNSGDVVAAAPLERRLLLLSDIPGVDVHSTLSPGQPVGTSDLKVDLTPGRRISGDLEADNAGNRYTGTWRGGGTVNLNDPLGIGDQLSVRVLTSGEGFNYVRGSYQALLGNVTAGVSYASLWYRLGDIFTPLHASGVEQIASVYASYPLIRSRDDNLNLLADFDYRTFRDSEDLTSSRTERRAEVVTTGLEGNHRDSIGGGGSDNYSLSASFGHLDIETPLARATDATTARSDGDYVRLAGSVDRVQALVGPLSLYGHFRGQFASKNLDISEKMELGGAYGVRAYPEGEAYGDEGYIATGEIRLDLPKPVETLPGRFELFGFVDTGWVRFNQTPWFAGRNTATLSGAGPGILWSKANDFLLKASYGVRLGGARAVSAPDRGGVFWFQLVKFF